MLLRDSYLVPAQDLLAPVNIANTIFLPFSGKDALDGSGDLAGLHLRGVNLADVRDILDGLDQSDINCLSLDVLAYLLVGPALLLEALLEDRGRATQDNCQIRSQQIGRAHV